MSSACKAQIALGHPKHASKERARELLQKGASRIDNICTKWVLLTVDVPARNQLLGELTLKKPEAKDNSNTHDQRTSKGLA